MTDPSITIDGETWHKYFSEYRFGDTTYLIDFFAQTDEEALDRLRAIRQQCIEATRIRGTISANAPCAGLRARFACWWRNLLGCE